MATRLIAQKEALNCKRLEIENLINAKIGRKPIDIQAFSQTIEFKSYAHRHSVSQLEQQIRETQSYYNHLS